MTRTTRVFFNTLLGLAWMQLADERKDNAQIDVATESALRLASVAERQRAQELFETMQARYGDKMATAHAARQFRNYSKLVASERMDLPTPGCVVPSGPNPASMAPVDPNQRVSIGNPVIYAGPCLSFEEYDNRARQKADVFFQGWKGHVTVGTPQPMPAPAAPASGTHPPSDQ